MSPVIPPSIGRYEGVRFIESTLLPPDKSAKGMRLLRDHAEARLAKALRHFKKATRLPLP